MYTVIKKSLTELKSEIHELVRIVESQRVEVLILRNGHQCARLVPINPDHELKSLKGFGRDLLRYDKDANLDSMEAEQRHMRGMVG